MAAVGPQLLTASPRGVRVEWSYSFDGNGALQWLDKIEQFFDFYEFTDHYRLKVATIYFDGPVVPWFRELQRSDTPLSWSDLAKAIESTFGPSGFDWPCVEAREIVCNLDESIVAEDVPEVLEEMPERDQGTVDMLEELAASDEPESKQFHQTTLDGIEERAINVISLLDSWPQEGEKQENLEKHETKVEHLVYRSAEPTNMPHNGPVGIEADSSLQAPVSRGEDHDKPSASLLNSMNVSNEIAKLIMENENLKSVIDDMKKKTMKLNLLL
ncbi:hypothetical protein J5N97_028225 [Dioscorea zingiberensis]|uniref:Retrotransposon gag domain-containing protein n=1 Tax=Dioscorea zingiberensis TaxID=325984 RepID=A0A9D5BYK4_9LILI|nr:hypothetical protein J5N97_028225 [Dioscorea zingiberensis]